MTRIGLQKLADKMKGKILQGNPAVFFNRFNIDSRLTEPGELFFALVAERDGHDFIPEAVSKGAAGVIVSRDIPLPANGTAVVQVNNTGEALQRLAAGILPEYDVKIVGITGSTGKTTTKEFAASLLAQNFNVLKSRGNFNNLIGLPLSILELTPEHEIAVLEMGMSTPGEIKRLTEIAPPDIAVITNIGPVHLEFFKGLEHIAQAKKEILNGTKKTGTAVLNGDDPLVRSISREWKGRKLLFGFGKDNDIRAENIEQRGWKGMSFDFLFGTWKGRLEAPFIYENSLLNFLAAAGTALALGLSPEEISWNMENFRPFSNRGGIVSLPGNITLINDSYNSNPRALESVLRTLSGLQAGRKVAILGDMLELGPSGKKFHLQAGENVVKWKWDILVTIGPLSRFIAEGAKKAGMVTDHIFMFETAEKAADKIKSIIQDNDLILVKGSRGIQTEKIVAGIQKKGS
ncbi:MAG: UDP-N-acetylmuramoyl-tripeptide--D-alanyl-D-alanine ligase [Candidatus Aminicenantes bacterium]|nr:UDP-N-acetylmuramoyl-tripeptide--D-alanyl-D-alanine ligase [Candidatus Aminicenantes bacterium]